MRKKVQAIENKEINGIKNVFTQKSYYAKFCFTFKENGVQEVKGSISNISTAILLINKIEKVSGSFEDIFLNCKYVHTFWNIRLESNNR